MAEPTKNEIDVRRLIFEDHQKSKDRAMQLNGDYGKWLIASLLLVHGAAIAFLAQSERLSQVVLPHVFWWHIFGLLAALTCGFLVWINWSLHAKIYDGVHPGMIYRDDHWPNFDSSTNSWITRTHWTAIGVGIVSAICILGSAIVVYCNMK